MKNANGKKLASALLAIYMLAQPLVDVAAAKVLIVEDRGYGTSAYDDATASTESVGARQIRETCAAILRLYGLRQGVDYDILGAPSYGVNAAQLRQGKAILYPNTSAAIEKTYDAIIINSMNPRAGSTGYIRGDSLVKWQNTTRYNAVPIMFVVYGSAGQDGASDSTVFGDDVTHMGTMGQVMYSTKNPAIRFRTGTNKVARKTGSPAGGYRVIIGASNGAGEGTQQDVQSAGFDTHPCAWCDSVYTTAPGVGDSAIVWTREYTNIPGAKPVVFTQSNDYAAVSLNIPAIWAAMVYVDSLTNGGVFGSAEPPSFGIMVPGIGSRGLATGYPYSTLGIPPHDTTLTYRAAGDSLATLGVPVSFGAPANLDSLTTYKRDIQRIMDASGQFRLFPFQRYGIDTSAAAIGAGKGPTTKYRPTDLFGAWRNRTAIGDDTFAGKDSSLSSHIMRAFAVHDSLYPGRVDHALFAPLDDWSPKNIEGIGTDSLYSAFARANARAVVTSYRIMNAQTGKKSTSQQGALWTTSRMNAPYAKSSVNVFAAEPVDSGSARFDNGSGQVGKFGGMQTFLAIDRFWSSFIGARALPTYGYGAGDNSVWTSDSSSARTRVLVVPFASFGSGTRADACCLPTRPGWWYTKAIVNAAKVINSCGRPGHTYIAIRPVEDVRP